MIRLNFRTRTISQLGRQEPWQFLRPWFRTLIVGVSVACLMSPSPAAYVRASGNTEAVLLSCMDFRLVTSTARYMESRGLGDKYDHVILAGASLGALTDQYPAWNKTFWDHLQVSIDLHKIGKAMILDHRDCGAYKVILGEDFGRNPTKETTVHAEYLKRLGSMIKAKYPTLEVELLLMSLDGQVEVIPPAGMEK